MIRLKFCWLLFAALIVLFIVAAPLNGLLRIGGDFRSFVLPLGIMGASVVVLAALTKMNKWLRFFFILTGASALGWPFSLYLNRLLINFFPNEPVTYVMFFFVFPLTFIAGVIGTIITGIWQKFTHQHI